MIKRLANIVCEEGHLFYAPGPEKAAEHPCWYVDAAHRNSDGSLPVKTQRCGLGRWKIKQGSA